MERLIGLISEAKKILDEKKFLSVTIDNKIFDRLPNILMCEETFDELKVQYDWQTKALSCDGKNYKEFIVINGVKVFTIRPIAKFRNLQLNQEGD